MTTTILLVALPSRSACMQSYGPLFKSDSVFRVILKMYHCLGPTNNKLTNRGSHPAMISKVPRCRYSAPEQESRFWKNNLVNWPESWVGHGPPGPPCCASLVIACIPGNLLPFPRLNCVINCSYSLVKNSFLGRLASGSSPCLFPDKSLNALTLFLCT